MLMSLDDYLGVPQSWRWQHFNELCNEYPLPSLHLLLFFCNEDGPEPAEAKTAKEIPSATDTAFTLSLWSQLATEH